MDILPWKGEQPLKPDSYFRVQGLWLRVQGCVGFKVWGLRFRFGAVGFKLLRLSVTAKVVSAILHLCASTLRLHIKLDNKV